MDVHTYKMVLPFLLKNDLKVMLKINLSDCENAITLRTLGYGLLVLYIVTNRSFLFLFVCF